VSSIGILGGMFNPPHLGHLALARQARQQLSLERVALVPANLAPHKDVEDDPGAEHRLRMCRLLVDDVDGLSACALEIERGGRSYTVDTLRAMHTRHPGARLTFIVGADAACTLAGWREPETVLELADLAVAPRAGFSRRQVLDAVAAAGADHGVPELPASLAEHGRAAPVLFLDTPAIDVSSSTVRRRAAGGEQIEQLVGDAVARHIAEHGLYRSRRRR
jgi:nicotinate-nucleotide adenylyltransferase